MRFFRLTPIFGLVFLLSLLPPAGLASAQTAPAGAAYYVVQEGDTLWEIAARFGLSVDELEQANQIGDPALISAGMELILPGLEYDGQLVTQAVPFGETLQSLSRRAGVSEGLLARLNRLTTPTSLYAGFSLIVPAGQKDSPGQQSRVTLSAGETLLELAALNQTSLWALIQANGLSVSEDAVPGERLFLPGKSGTRTPDGPGGLPVSIRSGSLDPLMPSQGKTVEIRLTGLPGMAIHGTLAGQELRFFPSEDGYVALQGISALAEPGLYPLILQGDAPGKGGGFEFSQSILIRSGNFPEDPELTVDPKTLDPAVTRPEDQLWKSLGAPVSLVKLWDGQFQSPVPKDFSDCWTSLFGNRRSYNGGVMRSFHSGLDFCGGIGTPLYAPAAGKVVYAGPLTVRGNVTVIDHGWGIYTAYDHQSEIQVRVGDSVKAGQVIGLGGETGRTTGPHLHWEVWVGGVQVDPVDWLKRAYP